jgi:antitoxin component YwqK of YwqJK toxin-antitoxin module
MDAPDEPKLVEEYGANGRLRRRSRIAGGLLHGLLEQFDDAGNLALLAQFDAGKQHGAMAVYDADGVLVQRCAFRHGLAHGLMETFVNGRRVAARTMVDGVANGESLTFDEAGRLAARVELVAGQLDGPAAFFDADAQVVQRCSYRATLLHGALRRYWPNGALQEETMYRDGVPLAPPTRFDLQGRALGPAGAASGLFGRLRRLLRWD